ncbi:MAG: hypothetical protein ACKVX7_02505 [Planctomycetota bacterium]
MSSLAKFFVVLVAFLNVTFFAMSATLYHTQKNWRAVAERAEEAQKSQLKEYKTIVEEAKGEISVRDLRNAELVNKNTELRAKYDDIAAEKNSLNSRISKLDEEKSGLTQNVNRKDGQISDKDAEIASLAEQNRKMSEELAEAGAAKTKAQSELARALLDRQQITEEADGYRTELVSLTEERDSQSLLIRAIEQKYPKVIEDIVTKRVLPPLDGVVVSVRDNLVVLSIGKGSDGVKEGYTFTVYRGSNYIATVQVTHVTEDMAAASILYPEAAKIQNGDLATTRILN